MLNKIKIESIEAEGFRGINEKKEFDFKKPIIFLFGKNRLGKSTTLYAIEWCLFGDIAYMKWLETSARVKDEIINIFNKNGVARVKLILYDDKNRYEITRIKKQGSGKTELILKVNEDVPLKDEKAEEKLFRILKLSFEGFYRSVFLHQESIKGLLIDEPSVRDIAMDRLFGLEDLRNIMSSIPVRPLTDEISKINRKIENLENRRIGALEEKERSLTEHEEEAEKIGLKRGNISFDSCLNTIKSVTRNLNTLSSQFKINLPQITYPTSVSNLKTTLTKIRGNLKLLRQQTIEILKLDEIIRKRRQLSEFFEDYKKNLGELKKINQALNNLKKRYRNISKIRKEIEKINSQIAQYDKRYKGIKADFRVIGSALDYLQVTDKNICPICGRKINRITIISELKKHLKQPEEKILNEINNRIKSLENKKEKLKDTEIEFSDLQEKLKKVHNEKGLLMERVIRLVGRSLKPREILTDIPNQISKLDSEIEKFEKERERREKLFSKIEDKIEELKIQHIILKERNEIQELKSISSEEAKNIGKLKKEMKELKALEDELRKISTACTNVQMNLAKLMIKKATPAISNFYSKLCNHPYYIRLKINVSPKERAEIVKNSYEIKAINPKEKRETYIVTRFSSGDMNSVALSIYLALSKILPHNLGFIILDDPTQSLSVDRKLALVKILKEISNYNQIIISTPDEQFQDILKKEFAQYEANIYNFIKWDRRGPYFELNKLPS